MLGFDNRQTVNMKHSFVSLPFYEGVATRERKCGTARVPG